MALRTNNYGRLLMGSLDGKTVPDTKLSSTIIAQDVPAAAKTDEENSMERMEQFEEEFQSHELLNEFMEQLAAMAGRAKLKAPDVEISGWIYEAGTDEAMQMRESEQKATGRDVPVHDYRGIFTRKEMLMRLRRESPQSLEWVPPSRGGAKRILPIVAFTKNGLKIAGVEY